MTPEISEFSYGFALTNEIVGWAPVAAAPLFPSLIEEGKAGGGYDVKLDLPGIPLYLQFKRADCMTTRNAREISRHGLRLSLPFYRFKITESGKSDQHELLLALDDGSCLVFYVAPRFHELVEINDAWKNNCVATNSIFLAPATIGTLDANSHHVAYDDNKAWLCSEPRRIDFLDSISLLGKLNTQLDAESRPLREKLPEITENIRSAEERARMRIRERTESKFIGDAVGAIQGLFERRGVAGPAISGRSPRALSEPEQQLREASDMAGRLFDAQLIIIQRRS